MEKYFHELGDDYIVLSCFDSQVDKHDLSMYVHETLISRCIEGEKRQLFTYETTSNKEREYFVRYG